MRHGRRYGHFYESFHFGQIHEFKPSLIRRMVVPYQHIILHGPLQHMSQYVEARLLHLIHELDQLDGRARVGDEQEQLRSPVLHMVFTDVQHQQVLPHLSGRLQCKLSIHLFIHFSAFLAKFFNKFRRIQLASNVKSN